MSDLVYILNWWSLFLLLSIVSFPLCWVLFKKFTDVGYGFSKTIGVLAISYIIFLFSIIKILPFERFSLYLVVLLFASVNLVIFTKNKTAILDSLKKNKRAVIFQEVLFTIGLIFWSYVRAHQPDINGLEKFMDYGFINSILRSKFLPPADMWYAGSSINYYWFGHFYTAVMTKLSNIPPSITYNLMIATILGLTLTSAFSIVSTLVKSLKLKLDKRVIFAAGALSALLLTFGGNFHTPIYALKNGVAKYWYPDATRFIGYNPETNDKTIHEFPLYSFVVSDLHPHLMNLPFVLLYIALLFGFLSNIKVKKWTPKSLVQIIPLGFLLGIFFMTSTWDFGNYLLTTGFVFLLFNLKRKGFNLAAIIQTAIPGVLVFLLGIITALPFIIHFDSIAQGIAFVNARSPLWQLTVLWGFPAILTAIFIALINKTRKIDLPDIFVVSLLVSSWVLILVPEIIYVKDIYIASHHRANTMFKLTYQAFVMFYLSSGYIAVRTLLWLKNNVVKISLLLFYALAFASILWYPNFAVKSYYGDLKTYKGLSGETWLSDRYPEIYKSVLWFRKNVSGQPTILEAPGDSYTDFNVISSYTGLPTVSGWFVHEWLWRGSAEVPQKRVTDIEQIYTSSDVQLTKVLLQKYNVEYLVVGEFEHQKYPNLNEQKLRQLGSTVFSSGNTKVFKLN